MSWKESSRSTGTLAKATHLWLGVVHWPAEGSVTNKRSQVTRRPHHAQTTVQNNRLSIKERQTVVGRSDPPVVY